MIYMSLMIAAMLACLGSFWYGQQVGGEAELARQKKTDDLVQQVATAAQSGAAKAIAAQQPINRTIVQKATREVETNTVYRECANTAGQLRNINAALTGQAEPAQPAGGSQLPSPGTADGR